MLDVCHLLYDVNLFHMLLITMALLASHSPAHATTSKNLKNSRSCVEQANLILTPSQGATDQLIAYLGQLLDSHVIGDVELSRFFEALSNKKVSNPLSNEDAELDSKKLIHREGLEKIIDLGGLNLKRLEEWTRHALEMRGVVQIKREKARDQSQDTHQRIEFVSIEPGKFKMGQWSQTTEVTLTHPFEVMSTLVTQKHWVEVMGENPSHFADGKKTITVTVAGKIIKMQPDNPVENVTWWSAIEYANRLSEKHGLRPAYDFSQIKFKANTRAEDGTLDVESGELQINAPNGNIYEALGFRLPTEAEQEYLIREGGKKTGKYSFSDSDDYRNDSVWYTDNSNQTTHPVAELKPVIINGREIFDINGNVSEWGQDRFAPMNAAATTNPIGALTGSQRVYRGGSWSGNPATTLQSAWRMFGNPGGRSSTIGFRLLRTLR